jgi:uncharacterized protein (DUF1697 family)
MNGGHIALLRGLNVGGKNKLPMKDLAALFASAGCHEVQTYIQSGNVVFGASAALAKKLPALVSAAISKAHGFQAPVVLRTAEELRAAARGNPFLKTGAALDTLHVAFLADAPTAAAISALDPKRSAGDDFAVRGREVYLRLPNGVARTKLTNAYFDKTLGTVSTLRNWRTLLELIALTEAYEELDGA